jgi:N utilization substance protein A
MQSQFNAAINQLVSEKNLPRDIVEDIIKSAFKAAYKKDFGTREQNIDVELSESGEMATVFQILTVVESVEDPDLEISPEEALKYVKTAKIGDEIRIDVTPMEYGRIAAQSAKQVIIQKLQEAEREILYTNFKDRENELIHAQVHRVQNDHVFIDLGKIIIELPRESQIRGEKYYAGQRLKLYLDKVVKTSKGPKLMISRTHPNLVRKLLEIEIPEITEGTVVVHKIARDPGVRCKITVSSTDPKIDPIGSCVGQKGVRIQSVMDEIAGERIDVLIHTDDNEQLLRSALAPAEVNVIKFLEDDRVEAYVEEEQRPLAIGRKGQNVRLASKLLDMELDIKNFDDLTDKEKQEFLDKKAKAQAKAEQQVQEAENKQEESDVDGLEIDQQYKDALMDANLNQSMQLKGLSVVDLQTIEGIDEEGAQQIYNAVN